MIYLLFTLISAYLIGSIPTGYLFIKIIKGQDIRKFGSGNTGATNVYRVGGVLLSITTLLIDLLKGFIPVLVTSTYIFPDKPEFWLAVGFSAIIGHMWTIFLKFKGGKGVATVAGVFLAILPVPTLVAFIGFIIIFLISRIVSLSSIISAILLTGTAFVTHAPKVFSYSTAFISLIVLFRHKANIIRLFKCQELKIDFSKNKKEEVK